MPPAKKQFLVRRVVDGTMRTVTSTSMRAAMAEFVAKFHPPKGEEYDIKERGIGDWETYKVR